MNILGIDTTTKTSSVAIYSEEKGCISECSLNIDLNHSNTLMKLIDSTIKNSQIELNNIDLIAVGAGPGSFTGVRVGIATAKALSYSLNIPIVGINTLDALAYMISNTPKKILPIMDARSGRVFTAEYLYDMESRIKRISDYRDIYLDKLIANNIESDIIFTGDGVFAYKAKITDMMKEKASFQKTSLLNIRASVFCEIALEKKMLSPIEIEPFYLVKSQAERQKEMRNE